MSETWLRYRQLVSHVVTSLSGLSRSCLQYAMEIKVIIKETPLYTQDFPSVCGYFNIQSETEVENEIWVRVPHTKK
jgi:hypothetical protein